ncbi:MAG TPA: IS91 family transposase [Caldilineaceae bacterium]|nr:IS91 family transposase [Caldilineaceae bacterium]
MVELADIFRRYGPAYREQFGERMPASHLQAMAAIEACRTEALGGHVYTCPACNELLYRYHSCRNRHCPKCQHHAAQAWLKQQQAMLLPVPYFLVTFTLPAALRDIARSNQQTIYTLLFRGGPLGAAEALQQLAQDPRFVGGRGPTGRGMMSVLQTWTRDLLYHPHLHVLIPGGGLTPDGATWRRTKNHFFVHVKPLARLFRAKFRDALKQTDLYDLVPLETWSHDWVVDCRPVGNGEAALRYLVPYIFRVAISNRRILKVAEDKVTFTYKDGDTGKTKHCTVHAQEFMRRFLQHVLPKGFVKIRYYGLLSPGNRLRLHRARALLVASADTASALPSARESLPGLALTPTREVSCPKCGQPMQQVQTLQRRSRGPPA